MTPSAFINHSINHRSFPFILHLYLFDDNRTGRGENTCYYISYPHEECLTKPLDRHMRSPMHEAGLTHRIWHTTWLNIAFLGPTLMLSSNVYHPYHCSCGPQSKAYLQSCHVASAMFAPAASKHTKRTTSKPQQSKSTCAHHEVIRISDHFRQLQPDISDALVVVRGSQKRREIRRLSNGHK